MSEVSRAKVLADTQLEPYSPNTCATLETLRKDLTETRLRGWFYDREERHAGMSCIGAAIFNDKQEPCAVISVSGPTARFDPERAPELAAHVVQAAQEITRLSGGQSSDQSNRSEG